MCQNLPLESCENSLATIYFISNNNTTVLTALKQSLFCFLATITVFY